MINLIKLQPLALIILKIIIRCVHPIYLQFLSQHIVLIKSEETIEYNMYNTTTRLKIKLFGLGMHWVTQFWGAGNSPETYQRER